MPNLGIRVLSYKLFQKLATSWVGAAGSCKSFWKKTYDGIYMYGQCRIFSVNTV